MNTRMWLLGTNQNAAGAIGSLRRRIGLVRLPQDNANALPSQEETISPTSSKGKYVVIAVCLLALEFSTSWYVYSEIMSRGLLGIIAYIGLVQTMPPEIALYHAQKIAVMDLL